jgi:hypothetical protein
LCGSAEPRSTKGMTIRAAVMSTMPITDSSTFGAERPIRAGLALLGDVE